MWGPSWFLEHRKGDSPEGTGETQTIQQHAERVLLPDGRSLCSQQDQPLLGHTSLFFSFFFLFSSFWLSLEVGFLSQSQTLKPCIQLSHTDCPRIPLGQVPLFQYHLKHLAWSQSFYELCARPVLLFGLEQSWRRDERMLPAG